MLPAFDWNGGRLQIGIPGRDRRNPHVASRISMARGILRPTMVCLMRSIREGTSSTWAVIARLPGRRADDRRPGRSRASGGRLGRRCGGWRWARRRLGVGATASKAADVPGRRGSYRDLREERGRRPESHSRRCGSRRRSVKQKRKSVGSSRHFLSRASTRLTRTARLPLTVDKNSRPERSRVSSKWRYALYGKTSAGSRAVM